MNYSSIKKTIIIAALCLLSFVPQAAKAQKVGHLNFQELIMLMPEYENFQTEYQLYQADLEDQLKGIGNEYEAKQKLLETESKKPAPSKLRISAYQKDMQNLQQEYEFMQQTVQDSLKAKVLELTEPLKNKITLVVKEIAKEQGYSHIIDNSYGTLIYADAQYDISELVKKKLNIKPKPAANPGAGRPSSPVSPR